VWLHIFIVGQLIALHINPKPLSPVTIMHWLLKCFGVSWSYPYFCWHKGQRYSLLQSTAVALPFSDWAKINPSGSWLSLIADWCLMLTYISCCVFIDGSSVEIKREADISECPHDDKPSMHSFVCISHTTFVCYLLCVTLLFLFFVYLCLYKIVNLLRPTWKFSIITILLSLIVTWIV